MWSEQVRSNPDVHLVRVPYPWKTGRDTNVFIVRGADECLLIDTGSPDERAWHVLSQALGELDALDMPAKVFLTHLHRDHAGLADRLADRGAALYVGAREHRLMELQASPDYFELYERNGLAAEGLDDVLLGKYAVTGSFTVERLDPDVIRLVNPGDVIEAAGLSFEVMRATGHTPGHLALFEPRSRLLFSGDHLLFDVSPSVEARLAPPNTLELYFEDLRRVRDLAPAQLLYAHGDLGGDVRTRADWLIDHHRARMDRAVEIVRAEPGLSGLQVIQRLPWNTHGRSWDELPFLLQACIMECGLATLNQLAFDERIARNVDDDRTYRYEST